MDIVYPTQVALAKQIGADGMVMVKDWPAFDEVVQRSQYLHHRPDCHVQR